jgi:sulfur-carrier protein
MKLNIKYFGMIAEWMNCSEQVIELESGFTVADVRAYLEKKNQKLSGISYQVAVDNKISALDVALTEENEIALLPPFAGG